VLNKTGSVQAQREASLKSNADLYAIKRETSPCYIEQRGKTIDANFRRAPIERVRSPREAQKRRMEGWSDCRFILPKLTLEGLRTVAVALAQEGQHSPWPRERRRYPRTKSHLVGEALDDFFRKMGFPEFCVEKEP
jgi:hypothetical protein